MEIFVATVSIVGILAWILHGAYQDTIEALQTQIKGLRKYIDDSNEQRVVTALRLEALALELGYKFIWNAGQHKPTKITKPHPMTTKSGCSYACHCCGN